MVLLEIDHVVLTVCDHAEEATARMVVLLVLLEMIGQFDDPLGQKSDLDLRRAGILVVNGCFLDDFDFLSRG